MRVATLTAAVVCLLCFNGTGTNSLKGTETNDLTPRNETRSVDFVTPGQNKTEHEISRKRKRKKFSNPNHLNSTETTRKRKNRRKKLSKTTVKPENFTPKRRRNRCEKNNGGCSQICKSRGKRKCFCNPGYVLAKNRKTCVDLNECKIKNGGCESSCKNFLGSWECSCPSGFRLGDDFKSCQDINECLLNNGHGLCQDTCINSEGSFHCSCFRLNGTRLAKDNRSCEDINECLSDNFGCSHNCINVIGRAFCSCPEGMELLTDYKTCGDLDECENEPCPNCVNTIGSYHCGDLQNDQSKSSVCPPLDPPQNGYITCNNSTKNGRKVVKNDPGTRCKINCRSGFFLRGRGRYICGVDGKWVVKKKGVCLEGVKPALKCPGDKTVLLGKEEEAVLVKFEKPESNVGLKYLKVRPDWAKNFQGRVKEGRHSIFFTIRDPRTSLISSCSFSVLVTK